MSLAAFSLKNVNFPWRTRQFKSDATASNLSLGLITFEAFDPRVGKFIITLGYMTLDKSLCQQQLFWKTFFSGAYCFSSHYSLYSTQKVLIPGWPPAVIVYICSRINLCLLCASSPHVWDTSGPNSLLPITCHVLMNPLLPIFFPTVFPAFIRGLAMSEAAYSTSVVAERARLCVWETEKERNTTVPQHTP